MPDNYVLYAPGGASAYNLGSGLLKDPGPDFGRVDLPHAEWAGNPAAEGAALAFESAGPRTMRFPVRLASGMANLSLQGVEQAIGMAARPGGFVDIQPQGVPSTEAVRFDVLAGRVNAPAYSLDQFRIGRREVTVELDVKPYGYWPTQIILGSTASLGLPGTLALSAPIGDAPGLAEVIVQPTTATNYPAGTWLPDMVAFSLGGRPSFDSFIRASAWSSAATGVQLSAGPIASLAPGAQFLAAGLGWPSGAPSWTKMAIATISQALEPAYRGRFRAFALAQQDGPSRPPLQLLLDAAELPNAAMASYQPIATLSFSMASGLPGAFAPPSPAFQLLDMGEISLPPIASGAVQPLLLRMWMKPDITAQTVASQAILDLAGVFLLPVERSGAVLARGLAQPSIGQPTTAAPTVGRLHVDSVTRRALIGQVGPAMPSFTPIDDALAYYRGIFPLVGASTVQLDAIGAARRVTPLDTPSYPQAVGSDAPFAWYRLEEAVGPTMLDSSGGGRPGSWGPVPSLGAAGIAGGGGGWNGVGSYPVGFVGSVIVEHATSWSIELWAAKQMTGSNLTLLAQGNLTGNNALLLSYGDVSADKLSCQMAGGTILAGQVVSTEGQLHHIVLTWNYANRGMALWKDGQLVGSTIAVTTYQASGPIGVGRRPLGSFPFQGVIDEIAFYKGTAFASDMVYRHFQAGASPMGGIAANPPTGPLVRSAPMFAAVSVRYTPRFQFLKGI